MVRRTVASSIDMNDIYWHICLLLIPILCSTAVRKGLESATKMYNFSSEINVFCLQSEMTPPQCGAHITELFSATNIRYMLLHWALGPHAWPLICPLLVLQLNNLKTPLSPTTFKCPCCVIDRLCKPVRFQSHHIHQHSNI